MEEHAAPRASRPGNCLAKALCSLGEHLRHHVEQVLVEEIQSPGHLLLDRGLLELELARQPEQLDLIAERVDELAALAVGPARRLELEELADRCADDAPCTVTRLASVGCAVITGRTRKRQHGADLGGRDALARRRREHAGEGAAQLLVAALAFALRGDCACRGSAPRSRAAGTRCLAPAACARAAPPAFRRCRAPRAAPRQPRGSWRSTTPTSRSNSSAAREKLPLRAKPGRRS